MPPFRTLIRASRYLEYSGFKAIKNIHRQFNSFHHFQLALVVTADLHFTHTDEYEKQSKTSYKLFKIKKIFFYEKVLLFLQNWKGCRKYPHEVQSKRCFRWPNTKNLKFCQRKRRNFLTIFWRVPALLLHPCYMKLLIRTTQVSETVFLISIFCLQQYSQSSHLSPYCFPILLIRTKGVLPILFRMLGRIFRGSGLVHIQTKSVHSQ